MRNFPEFRDWCDKLDMHFRIMSNKDKPGLKKISNASEIFQWVERLLDTIAWMENALPSGYRIIGELKEV